MKFSRYESRFKAGEILADFVYNNDKVLGKLVFDAPNQSFCFAIPNGGIPVVEGFCFKLNINYDILIVRKIKIPYNTEAGFGSVTPDGTILINESLLQHLDLSQKAINNSIELTKQEINERLKFYEKDLKLENFYEEHIYDKYIFILDDGLASGFTMLAAINMVRKYHPKKVLIAVPTAPLRTVKKIKENADHVFCPNIRDVLWFAVADAYKDWYDVPESEVVEILNNSKYYVKDI